MASSGWNNVHAGRTLARMKESPTCPWGILLQALGGTVALKRYLGMNHLPDTVRWGNLGIARRYAHYVRQCVIDCSLEDRLELRLEDDEWFLRLKEAPDA